MALGELLRSKKSSLAFYYNLKQNESWSGKFLITPISCWIFLDCRSLRAYQLCIFGKVS